MTIRQQIEKVSANVETATRAREFAAVCRWLMIGKGNLGNALAAAKTGRATQRIIEGIKAAVSGGTTSDGTFASPLAYAELADAFLVSLRNAGCFDSALPFAKQIPLNTRISVTTAGTTAASIGEASAKIISRLTLASTTLQIRKAVCILVTDNELLKIGGALASNLFSAELQRAVVQETDAQFLSILTNSISPISSSGSNAVAIAQDLASLFAAMSLDSQSKVFVVMSPNDLKHVAVQVTSIGSQAFPGATIHGGTYAGAVLIPSDSVSGQIIGFDAAQLAMASNSIELNASNQASIQMDSVPDSPPSASTPAASFWQLNETGLRATRFWGTERPRATAVAVISNVSYGSANSPA